MERREESAEWAACREPPWARTYDLNADRGESVRPLTKCENADFGPRQDTAGPRNVGVVPGVGSDDSGTTGLPGASPSVGGGGVGGGGGGGSGSGGAQGGSRLFRPIGPLNDEEVPILKL